MYALRKEDLSVYLYLKDLIFKDFIEFQEYDELVLSHTHSNSTTDVYTVRTELSPSPFEHGRGIPYFDDLTGVPLDTVSGTKEQSNRVFVYDASYNLIDENAYMVDYVSGRIIPVQNIEPKYISYYWHYVGLIDEWSYLTASNPPMVVLDIERTTKVGYQLGGGKKVVRQCKLHIFASSSAERKDLTEMLYDSIYQKCCPFYDFPKGTVLDFDGTFYNRNTNLDKVTNLFDRTTVSGSSSLRFEDVEARNINLPLTLSRRNEATTLTDLNSHRARINFNLVSYR